MINKHEVRIYFPEEIKNNQLLNQLGFLPIVENLKFVRFVNDIKMYVKDEIANHYDNTTRELNIEYVVAYLNVEENSDNSIKVWFTDKDHRLFGVSKNAKSREAYEILLFKKIAPQLIDALNKFLVAYNTDISQTKILESFGWTFNEKSKCWTNPRMERISIQESEAWDILKQEIIETFEKEIKNLEF